VLGLRRALLAAGAQQVVTALWQVPDEDTMWLMTRFYEHLWKDRMHPVEALAAAQREAIERMGEATGSAPPRCWAGFVLTLRDL
jgi:CHAT domain-containing protein